MREKLWKIPYDRPQAPEELLRMGLPPLLGLCEALLRQGKRPRVAAGFGSVGTFNRIFRTSKNCTPSQYRALYGDF